GNRALLSVPLLRGTNAIGALTAGREQPGPFTKRQIALVKTFADQAVIALENARLFGETSEALDQQKAISDILGVISRSPSDLQPVFDTILSHVVRLCDGSAAVLWRYDGAHLRFAASRRAGGRPGTGEAAVYYKANPLPLGAYNPTPQAGLERRTIHVLDVFSHAGYRPLIPRDTFGTLPNAGTVLAV